MNLKVQRILNNQTYCNPFISDWKNIVLPGVTLSFKHLKWRKVSLFYLQLNVYQDVSINTADITGELEIQQRFQNRTNDTNTNFDLQ